MCIITTDTMMAAACLVDQNIWVYDLEDGSFWHNRGLTKEAWRAKLEETDDWDIIERSLESWRHVDMSTAFPIEMCVNGRYLQLCCTPVKDSTGRTCGVIGVEKDVTLSKSLVPRLKQIQESRHVVANHA